MIYLLETVNVFSKPLQDLLFGCGPFGYFGTLALEKVGGGKYYLNRNFGKWRGLERVNTTWIQEVC